MILQSSEGSVSETAIEKLWSLGFSVRAVSGNIEIRPASIPAGLRAIIAARKAEILALLEGTDRPQGASGSFSAHQSSLESEPVSIERMLEIARGMCANLSRNDPDRLNLERQAIEAKARPGDDTARLGLGMLIVAIHRRRFGGEGLMPTPHLEQAPRPAGPPREETPTRPEVRQPGLNMGGGE